MKKRQTKKPTPAQLMGDEQLFDAVAAALNRDGFTAEAQYTGGGIWCVSILEPALPNASWLCGNSADEWGGTLMEADSYAVYESDDVEDDACYLHCVGLSSDSTDAAAIAVAVAREIRQWRTRHPPYRTLIPGAMTGA